MNGNRHSRQDDRPAFSLQCCHAMFAKEFIHLRRDTITLLTMIMLPLLQLVLFGYAINTDPKHLPASILSMDNSAFSRSIVAALHHTNYLEIGQTARDEDELNHQIVSGKAQFAIQIPANFGRDLVRGEKPQILVIADATDPVASAGAISAVQGIIATVFSRELTGPLASLAPAALNYDVVVQKRYNPAGATRLNIVPGLIGVLLTLTTLIFTAISLTREVERGTMETLLAMPITPLEIMLGKISPYIVMGAIEFGIILIAAKIMFSVPITGSIILLAALTLLFIIANLSVGYTFSTIASNQLQAMQMTFFFFLPSILLSGFMFPFRGMPVWAQWIGETLPLTHYVRIVRGIMLKNATTADLVTDILALTAFTLVAMIVALTRFRQTLD